MRAEFASVAARSDRPNGNWVGVTAGAVVLLDSDGCGTERELRLFGSSVLGRIADPAVAVRSCLGEVSVQTQQPSDGCEGGDFTRSPRLAAAVLRCVGGVLEWVVVHDAVVVLDVPGGLRVIVGELDEDGRTAAGEPVSGRVELADVRQAAVLSGGAARLVTFGLAVWRQVMDTLAKDGPQVLIDEIRQFEAVDREGRRWPRSGTTDDATAVLVRF
ncbi:hypothetical protein [Streptomyces sp. NPDC018059]|uniref:hypothetical protein n=1 Tax=Streptomyces sp. NPDC018059 TaxID=3365041 RepID=UPI0037A8E941